MHHYSKCIILREKQPDCKNRSRLRADPPAGICSRIFPIRPFNPCTGFNWLNFKAPGQPALRALRLRRCSAGVIFCQSKRAQAARNRKKPGRGPGFFCAAVSSFLIIILLFIVLYCALCAFLCQTFHVLISTSLCGRFCHNA